VATAGYLIKKAVSLLENLLLGSPENKVKTGNYIYINAKSNYLFRESDF
jgi:hypothetical protein